MALLQKLFARIRSVGSKPEPQPTFRDPVADFGVALTDPDALAAPPQHRIEPGPFTSEHNGFVSLHFGQSTADGVHAIMNRAAPNDLVFSYTQIMAGFHRFVTRPRHIGIIGLGGGSLAKYCLLRFPHARVTVAEISADVISLRDRFLIPADDARFTVLHTDGLDLIARSRGAYDVLLVDAFNEGGHLPHFGTDTFYLQCRRALTDTGIVGLNFSGEALRAGSPRLVRTFPSRTVLYRCPDGDNVIAFATKGPLPPWTQAVRAGEK